MSQRQINAAYRRNLKTTYKNLSPAEYRIVKIIEKIERNNREIANIERHCISSFGANWRKMESCKKDFDFYLTLNAKNISLSEKRSRLEDRHGIDAEQLFKKHRMNQSAKYTGSF